MFSKSRRIAARLTALAFAAALLVLAQGASATVKISVNHAQHLGVKEGGADTIEISSFVGEMRVWEVYLTTRELNCTKQGTIRTDGPVRVETPGDAVFTIVGTLTSETRNK